MIKRKEFKEKNFDIVNKKEVKMGLLGRGRGYCGLPKAYNVWIRLIIIWLVLGGLGFFLFSINQIWAGFISLACGLMFSLFNNYLKDYYGLSPLVL